MVGVQVGNDDAVQILEIQFKPFRIVYERRSGQTPSVEARIKQQPCIPGLDEVRHAWLALEICAGREALDRRNDRQLIYLSDRVQSGCDVLQPRALDAPLMPAISRCQACQCCQQTSARNCCRT